MRSETLAWSWTDPDVAAADEQQRQDEAQQQNGHLVGAPRRSQPGLPAEGLVRGAGVAGEHVVLRHRHRTQQGQGPNDAQPGQRVPAAADARRALGAHHGDVAVHGHGHQREDADQHAGRGEEVSELAEEGSEHPLWQGVDGGVERDAEEEEEEVRHAQVHDEDVGGAERARATAGLHPADHQHHQGVPEKPHHEDQPEHQRHDHHLRPGLPRGAVSLRPAVRLVSRRHHAGAPGAGWRSEPSAERVHGSVRHVRQQSPSSGNSWKRVHLTEPQRSASVPAASTRGLTASQFINESFPESLHIKHDVMIWVRAVVEADAETQTVQTILLVVTGFTICWMPHHIIVMWVEFGTYPLNDATFALRIVSHCLSYGNSCINPILYAFLSENFRKACRQVFARHLLYAPPADGRTVRFRMDNFSTTHSSTNI
ncbi:hypothetical protein CCH79_00020438 [Gambusia affinis]|uniref:G-protein coupled receptors family 1 profile domain-containing protein n=1 Tax=Gambusia affinis TaxID=33528 RepID=A0A315V9I6_GAMAF|nr:hypothetical protein CCH79_00020438 [Gambusia affinis]